MTHLTILDLSWRTHLTILDLIQNCCLNCYSMENLHLHNFHHTVLCSISEFFHKSKICYSCKNVLLFVCILKGNSYFYLLCQFSAVCLLGNNNLFTFSK